MTMTAIQAVAPAIAPITTMDQLLQDATLSAEAKKFLIQQYAIQLWQRLCNTKQGAGASTACRLLGKTSGFSKGCPAKTALKLLSGVTKAQVELAITQEESKRVEAVQEAQDAGTMDDDVAAERLEKIKENYANARAWLNSLDISQLVTDVTFLREHRNTINVTIKAKKAFGARVLVTIDETISEFLGQPIKNADVAKACEQGLARFD